METSCVVTNAAEETFRLGMELGSRLEPGDCVALVGDLGAGKTTFVQGVAAGMGIQEVVNSPSYLIVQEYFGKAPLFHIDAYRLQGAAELAEIGFEAYLDVGGVVVVEWADRVAEALPAGAVWIAFEIKPAGVRQIRISSGGPSLEPGLQ